MTADAVFSWFGQLLAAGGSGAVVAYAAFKFLGRSWIEHQLAKELEVAKSEISLMAARKLKLHDREYVVFPELWLKLTKAFASLGPAIVAFKRMPDLDRMAGSEFQVWVERSDLSENEKDYFDTETKRISAYSRILDLRLLNESSKDLQDFHNNFQANRIFLAPELKDKLQKIDDLIRQSWSTRKLEWDDPHIYQGSNLRSEAWNIYDRQIKPLMEDIESLVQARLFPAHIPTSNRATK